MDFAISADCLFSSFSIFVKLSDAVIPMLSMSSFASNCAAVASVCTISEADESLSSLFVSELPDELEFVTDSAYVSVDTEDEDDSDDEESESVLRSRCCWKNPLKDAFISFNMLSRPSFDTPSDLFAEENTESPRREFPLLVPSSKIDRIVRPAMISDYLGFCGLPTVPFAILAVFGRRRQQ